MDLRQKKHLNYIEELLAQQLKNTRELLAHIWSRWPISQFCEDRQIIMCSVPNLSEDENSDRKCISNILASSNLHIGAFIKDHRRGQLLANNLFKYFRDGI